MNPSAAPNIEAPKPHAKPPGPKGKFLLGNLSELRADPLKTLLGAAREFGDVVKLDLVVPVFLINHPSHIKHVLQDNHLNYKKSIDYERLEALGGKGLVSSEGDFWKRQRRMAQPAFHKQRIAGFRDLMVKRTRAMLEAWNARENGSRLDVHAEMMKLTLAIVGEALFSADLLSDAEEIAPAVATTLRIIEDRTKRLFVLPGMIPTPENLRFNRAVAILDKLVHRIISERRADSSEHHDLLGMFMAARDEESGESMSDKQLRDEVMTLMLAGHETTANALSWTMLLLSKNPHVEQKLLEELSTVLQGREPVLEDLPKLRYTMMVAEESMRLYPPAWMMSREALGEDQLGDFFVPKGTTIVMSQYVTHRDPRFFEKPEEFFPEHFTPERTAARPRFAYFPFGGGPRQCIGNNFAMMEFQLLLAMVMQRFELRIQPEQAVEAEPVITLRPKNGLWMTLAKRASP